MLLTYELERPGESKLIASRRLNCGQGRSLTSCANHIAHSCIASFRIERNQLQINKLYFIEKDQSEDLSVFVINHDSDKSIFYYLRNFAVTLCW